MICSKNTNEAKEIVAAENENACNEEATNIFIDLVTDIIASADIVNACRRFTGMIAFIVLRPLAVGLVKFQ